MDEFTHKRTLGGVKMSVTAAISYSSLNRAASSANAVAKRLTVYENNLNNSVYRKLNGYSGSYTGNIATAKSQTNAKITELRNKSQAYRNYANELGSLKEKCQSTDRAVRTMVSYLTATFKKANGIRNNSVENAINYLLTGLKNMTPADRWINSQMESFQAIKDYIKQKMKTWWNYEGGEEVVKGELQSLFNFVIGVADVILAVVALMAGGSLIVAVAAIVGGMITIINAETNAVTEAMAYTYRNSKDNEDPARAKRLSDEDTMQDYLRKETDSEFWHDFATGMDIAEWVCDFIGIVDGIGDFVKNTHKWATGSLDKTKDLRVKDILTKDGRKSIIKKMKAVDIKNYMKNDFLSDFWNSLSKFGNKYKDFSDLESGTKTIKNWASIGKSITKGDYDSVPKGVKSLFRDLISPNIQFGQIETYSDKEGHEGETEKSSVFKLSDTIKGWKKMTKLWKSGGEIMSNLQDSGNVIDKKLLEKLTQKCDFSINIKSRYMPAQ